MKPITYLVISVLVFAFALFSSWFTRSVLTLPIVFSSLGLALSYFSPHLIPNREAGLTVISLAELTLVLVLFSNASRIDLPHLKRHHSAAIRLLALGLPLTIVFGFSIGTLLFPALGHPEAAILAIILSPTDAALGQSVVKDPEVPQAIRETLSVESGLNDGICLPLLMIAIVIAGITREIGTSPSTWVKYAAEQITIGFATGTVVGVFGGRAYAFSYRTERLTEAFKGIAPLTLATLAYGLAGVMSGNGFISAFTTGLFYGHFAPQTRGTQRFAEAQGQLLTLFVFFLFGFWMVPELFHAEDPKVWLYALASLTVIRMIPVLVSLIGLKYRLPTRLFFAWFGPRGMASILYVLLVLERVNATHEHHVLLIRQIVTATVATSIVLHGLSARPLAKLYATWSKRAAMASKSLNEFSETSNLPVGSIETVN